MAFACVIIRLDDTLAGRLGRVFETLRVNDTSGVPVWIQIRNHMIFLIRSGHLRPGDTLPTVRRADAMTRIEEAFAKLEDR